MKVCHICKNIINYQYENVRLCSDCDDDMKCPVNICTECEQFNSE